MISWKAAALPTFADKQSSAWPFCTPPKALVNPDGSLGEPNDVYTAGTEHKLGINGNPTCTLNYGENGGATGHLVGEPNHGLEYMLS